MTAKEFIISRLSEIAKRLPEIIFRYEFNPRTSTHIIEIQPFETYMDKTYVQEEFCLNNEFDEMFYPESLLFISTESLTQIDRPEIIINKDGIEFPYYL